RAAAGPRPAWLRVIAGLAAVALASSAAGYLFRDEALAWIVYVSGPALLLWISATGVWLTAARRRPAGQLTAAGRPS
ncbi:MAG TPA: hypothetical protein VGH88_16925, partial [Streptosporangiaceae bacterium]